MRRMNGTASRPYGGLSHTRPCHGAVVPSSKTLYIVVAVRHGMKQGVHGSVSNGPSASTMRRGVSQVFWPESAFMLTDCGLPIG